ncbi:Chromosome partitioning ATPase, Mrp family, contains Fe-S cluster [Clostridium collagenovorans DSM 3089]|uniref:Iron-sulfur cluster carrier protein n=1 Tax=Clostridium collagenovorans DSM 3089 TaxID=1121306 RepID=A0A1M5SJ31_9CLOT|nr:Mrp/NBP35 family ATP-binding protein [Clostridium collagenovorans]SHH38475.1 Chromosome partitioning ATPase, Mrp family, contains Fe-S cluster [Clostridium collagenovorans DSM 3089]
MSNCSTCPSNNGCTKDKTECMIENNPMNNIKNVIGVMSGKGGVGKSTISTMIARGLKDLGYSVGILDADITGPSIPRLMGLQNKRADGTDYMIYPLESDDGIKVISLNSLIEDENQPVIWRGPVIAGMVKQFWTDVLWEELDYLIIDMPPGTGDVALTVMQSIPIDGLVMVSVPQDLVSMIVTKAINMANKMDVKVLGIIENMSYILCPDCNKKIKLFNESNLEDFTKVSNIKLLGELPMVSEICNLSNNGYNSSKETLNTLFSPIVQNVLSALNEVK